MSTLVVVAHRPLISLIVIRLLLFFKSSIRCIFPVKMSLIRRRPEVKNTLGSCLFCDRAIHDVKATDLGLSKVRFKAEVDFDGRVVTRSYLEKQDIDQILNVSFVIFSISEYICRQNVSVFCGTTETPLSFLCRIRFTCSICLFKQPSGLCLFLFFVLQDIQQVKTPEELERFMLKHGENIIDTLGAEVDRLEKELKVIKPSLSISGLGCFSE